MALKPFDWTPFRTEKDFAGKTGLLGGQEGPALT